LPPPHEIADRSIEVGCFFGILHRLLEFDLAVWDEPDPFAEFIALVSENTKETTDAKIQVIVRLDFDGRFVEQDGRTAAERFEVNSVRRELTDDSLGEVTLAAEPLNWGSNQHVKFPFLWEYRLLSERLTPVFIMPERPRPVKRNFDVSYFVVRDCAHTVVRAGRQFNRGHRG
jgi:hypothetical protein